MLKNKIVVVTGAGTIGCGIIDKLLKENEIHSVRVIDNSEIKLHELKQRYRDIDKLKLIYCDIRDKDRISTAIHGSHIVFHTAAMKHVSICEQNPIDAVKTNIYGTQNLIDESIKSNIEKFIYISTDKSVNPVGVMGATKLLGERLVTCADNYSPRDDICFCSVRFGNVIDSSGSVSTIFKNQYENGKKLTVTDENMTRFMISLDDAVELIFKATDLSIGNEIFILKMKSLHIIDLVEAINKNRSNIEITNKSDGEKIHEILLTQDESSRTYENNTMFVIIPIQSIEYYKDIGFVKTKDIIYSSCNSEKFSIDEIRRMINND